ncbi:MAG: hypothetical protein HYY01_04955 [Chloroflexi bacterium]|nr:hypothetical protein [Chloroflexota bacterium]
MIQQLLDEWGSAKSALGVKSNKFVGAVTVEVLRRQLATEGVPTSQRDVFIHGLELEIDLLVLKREVQPRYGVLFQPEDVLAVIEIKSNGSYGQGSITRLLNDYRKVDGLGQGIYFAYVTFTEGLDYKWRVTEETPGVRFPAYTLSWHHGSGANYSQEPTDDWQKLLNDVRQWTRHAGFGS